MFWRAQPSRIAERITRRDRSQPESRGITPEAGLPEALPAAFFPRGLTAKPIYQSARACAHDGWGGVPYTL